MKHNSISYLLLLCQVLFLVTLVACSQESNSVVSKAYHNTTAHYNAYYLANEKVAELENAIFKGRKDDYNQILDIIMPIDSGIAQGQKALTEYAVQKASLAIQRHKNSKWLDDSYLLVGKAQFYQMDFPNAIKAFKYVRTNSKDKNAQHRALIELFRTYVQLGEYNNAKAVVNFIKKEKPSKQNLADFYLIRAQLHKEQEEYLQAAGTLALAAPLMPKGEEKARAYYIIGQLYEKLGNQNQAYKSYRSTVKNNPTYELSFYAKLHMIQTSLAKKSLSQKKVLAYFKKMLRDEKNVDYKDKVYYHMGLYAHKLDNQDQAIDYLKKSVAANTNDALQKAYSYLKIGEIYYENLQQYELSKAYYDSTIQTLPPSAPSYELVARRQKVLDKFVEQITTIQVEDSLQRMAKMDSVSLEKYLDETIAREEAKKQAIEDKQTNSSNQAQAVSVFDTGNNNNNNRQNNNAGSKWYFYNPTALGQGKAAFTKKWGNRPLEDNWRRSGKEVMADFNTDNQQSAPVAIQQDEAYAKDQSKARKEQIYAALPRSEEALAASNKKIEEAHYNLGKIYNLELEEPKNAVSTFESLLTRFPQTEYEPETLYFLYLIHKNLAEAEKEEQYKNQLLTKHPQSSFARIISNPNYIRDDNMAETQLKEQYANAFELYESGAYAEANQQIDQALQNQPNNSLTDNFRLLKILIIGRTQDTATFKKALNEFMDQYPQSKLIPYVQNILKNSDSIMGRIK